jgi:hypothetical protein
MTKNIATLTQPIPTDRTEVRCPTCRAKLFDGHVIKGVSIIRLLQHSAEGKCKQCKGWVGLPVVYLPEKAFP